MNRNELRDMSKIDTEGAGGHVLYVMRTGAAGSAAPCFSSARPRRAAGRRRRPRPRLQARVRGRPRPARNPSSARDRHPAQSNSVGDHRLQQARDGEAIVSAEQAQQLTRHRRQIGGGEIEDEVGYNEAATGSMQEDGLVYLRHAADDDARRPRPSTAPGSRSPTHE